MTKTGGMAQATVRTGITVSETFRSGRRAFGSIILLYNNVVNQKNLSIILPDDPTDANKDYTYILPINSAAYLEEHDNTPDLSSPNPAYVYPAATSTAGYGPATNQWVQHIALNNTGGDVLSVISRADRDSAFFLLVMDISWRWLSTANSFYC